MENERYAVQLKKQGEPEPRFYFDEIEKARAFLAEHEGEGRVDRFWINEDGQLQREEDI